jgi:hypothetical protein
LRLRRFSTLNDLLLAHSPYPTTDADAVFLTLDTYRFCKLISDTIKTTVDIGCGSGAGGMRFIPHEPCRALRAAGWVANAARFPVPFGRTALQQADSVVEGHALN